MKRMILNIILVLSLPAGFAFGQGEADARFIMPPQQALSWSEPVECIAIASAGLHEERRELEDFDHPKLSGYIKKGTDRFNLWIDGKNRIVQAGDMKPDRYLVSRRVNK